MNSVASHPILRLHSPEATIISSLQLTDKEEHTQGTFLSLAQTQSQPSGKTGDYSKHGLLHIKAEMEKAMADVTIQLMEFKIIEILVVIRKWHMFPISSPTWTSEP